MINLEGKGISCSVGQRAQPLVGRNLFVSQQGVQEGGRGISPCVLDLHSWSILALKPRRLKRLKPPWLKTLQLYC